MKTFLLAGIALFLVNTLSFSNELPLDPYDTCMEWSVPEGGAPTLMQNSLYAITFGTDVTNNLGRYSFYPQSSTLNYDAGAAQALAQQIPYGISYNPVDGQVYTILGDTPGSTRNAYLLDPNTGATTLLGAVVSAGGSDLPNAFAIGPDGTGYVTFGSLELNTIDLTTGTTTALGTMPANGGIGLTYDTDNDRLIFTQGTNPINVYEVDPVTGIFNLLYTESIPGATGPCTASALQYVGYDTVISSSVIDCDIFFQIDLSTGTFTSLEDPISFDPSIKDFVYVNTSAPFTIECADATVEVQADLSIPANIGTFSNADNNLYAFDLNATGGIDDIHLYNYDPTNDAISVKTAVVSSTGDDAGFIAADWHPILNKAYLIQDAAPPGPEGGGGSRVLYEFELETGVKTAIASLVSDGGSVLAQDMAFGPDGALYVIFKTGEIGLFDFATNTTLPFGDIGIADAGGVGLTFDFDNNRLLHASSNPVVNVNAYDIATGTVSFVTTYDVATVLACAGTSQGLEYLGNNKAVSSTTFGCDGIFTVDLLTGDTELIRRPNADDGFDTRTKDLMYIGMNVTASPDSYSCSDVGSVPVTISGTDLAGNEISCSVTLTIEDPNDFCGLSVDDFSSANFSMYPNPANDNFTVNWNQTSTLSGLEIFDMLGKSVLSLDKIDNNNPVVSVATLKAGVYIVKLFSTDGTQTARLIKQ